MRYYQSHSAFQYSLTKQISMAYSVRLYGSLIWVGTTYMHNGINRPRFLYPTKIRIYKNAIIIKPSSSFSVHLSSSTITPAEYVHTSRADNMLRMWVKLMRWCVLCGCVLKREHSGDGCELASTMCKYDLR